jgi:hypothetical protein
MKAFFCALALFVPFACYAATETTRLICAYSQSVDDKGKIWADSGEVLIRVLSIEGGRAILSKEGLGAEFTGKITEDEISGEAEYTIQNAKFSETMHINRFTGAFKSTFSTQTGGGLLHLGTCRAASKALF